MNANDDCRMLR